MPAKPLPPNDRPAATEVVRSGWNRISYRYRPRGEHSDCFGHTDREYRAWLRPILERLPEGSNVLDLGCGTGVPAARVLAKRFRVTGVDLSEVQIRRARRLVPGARFRVADMSEVDFRPGSFSAVVSLYSLIHLPRSQHRGLLRRIARWLEPGGWLLLITGHTAYEGTERGWLGSNVAMFWSHYAARVYRRWLTADGFRILAESFVPEGDGGHELFLARTRRRDPVRAANAPRPAAASGRRGPSPPRPRRARRPDGGRARPLSRSA